MRVLRVTLRILLVLFIIANLLAIVHVYQFTRFYDSPGTSIEKPEHMSTWEKTKVMLTGFHFPKSVNTVKPSLPFDTITLTTADEMKLSGWYIPHDSAIGTVLLFHGHGAAKSKVLNEAYYFHSLGYNTLLIDFRAHGDSEGYVSTIGYREARDVKAAYDYIQAKGEKHIVLWGVSLGAATIAHAMAEYDIKPEKVIMELSFGNATGAVKARVRAMGAPEQPAAALFCFWGSVVRGFWVFGLNPEDYVKKVHCPVLVQHAAKDGRVTLKESETIFHNIPHDNKKLVVYETAIHESLCVKEPEKWKKEIKEFLEQ
jgi:alpha-beta hydrolase superfamily lysophospholipase